MNINQLLNIFDWNIRSKIDDTLIQKIFPNAKYMIGLRLGDNDYRFDVVFNNLTSEVSHIEMVDGWLHWTDETQFADIKTTIENGYFEKSTPLEDMIKLMIEKVGKEPDEFLSFNIDEGVLAKVDEEAAKLDITRNSFLTKVLLNYIKKANDETNIHT